MQHAALFGDIGVTHFTSQRVNISEAQSTPFAMRSSEHIIAAKPTDRDVFLDTLQRSCFFSARLMRSDAMQPSALFTFAVIVTFAAHIHIHSLSL